MNYICIVFNKKKYFWIGYCVLVKCICEFLGENVNIIYINKVIVLLVIVY